MKPYYQDDAVTIYHADCRDILPLLPDKSIDLVLTDPPYGLGIEYESYNDTPENWQILIDFIIPWGKAHSQMMILPSGGINKLGYYYRKFPPDWIICWYKGSTGHLAYVGFNEWESLLVYGKIKGLQMHDHFYCSTVPADNGHPCPKPINWARWLIAKTGALSIIDPFMGSGAVLRAAKDLNRRCIGIEIEEKYCEIAAKRCSQTVMRLE